MCGVLGLKTTYGRVSRYGLLAFGSSLDQIGPLARCARDAAITLGVIAGLDPADSTTASEPVADYASALTGDVRGTRIGVPASLIDSGVDPDITRAFNVALETLKGRGATLVDIEMPHVDGFALTHVHDVDHIRLLCRAHNQQAAELLYGRVFMERLRESRKEAKAAARAPGAITAAQTGPMLPGLALQLRRARWLSSRACEFRRSSCGQASQTTAGRSPASS